MSTLMEKTEVGAVTNYSGLPSEFQSDGDPDTLEIAFLPKIKGTASSISNVRPCETQRFWFEGVSMKIIVSTVVAAPMHTVWRAYTTPEDIKLWNAASPDWHTTAASVDLRPGGKFSSRMEAKDGSYGFDFEGEYTKVVPHQAIEYAFGGRLAAVEFRESAQGVTVRVSFDAEKTHTEEQQRAGWQAILDNFARHVQGKVASE
jgi:uncharacterized protein YndB with AHSA1/START domain